MSLKLKFLKPLTADNSEVLKRHFHREHPINTLKYMPIFINAGQL